MDNATLIALGTFLFTVGSTIVGITLGIRKISDNVMRTLNEHRESTNQELAELRLSMEKRTGEVGHSLREKITQVEFHMRDHYVSNKVFERLMDMAGANIENQFRTMQESMNRINDKLDGLVRTTDARP